MKIIIGCDENGVWLKETLKSELAASGVEFTDYNESFGDDTELYPDIAVGVCRKVLEASESRGILICGTGVGMSISANKVPGIRAAICHDAYSTERALKSNNAQIMCMGAQIIGSELAKSLLHIWLDSEYSGGRSVPKLARIDHYDELFRRKDV